MFRSNTDYRKFLTLVGVDIYDRLFCFDLQDDFVHTFESLLRVHIANEDFPDSAGHSTFTISCVPIQV